jgi:phage terminase large subunit-like protein
MTRTKKIDPTTLYAKRVVAGEIVAGKLVIQACERHLHDLRTAKKRGLKWSPAKAARAIRFFKFLKHSKGEWAGQSFQLELWQKFIVGSLFGWLRADGTRRFRTGYAEVPRKNGKSTLTSGIALYLLIADGEPGADVYTAATKLEQAKIVHGEAVRMVKASPALKKRVQIFADNLSVLKTNSKFEPLSGEGETHDGLNIHGAVVDELHAHRNRLVVDVIETATGARRQPLIFYITTAGWDRTSVCWENHQYGEQVLSGVITDDTYFVYIATLDKDDDWTDPTVWAKANPNYGVSVKPDDLARKCEKARQIPAAQNAFKRLHLNVWTEQAERWLDLEKWDACNSPVDAEALVGRDAYAGLDLADTTDIAALVLVFPEDVEEWIPIGEDPAPEELDEQEQEAEGRTKTVTYFDVLVWFWVPGDTVIERSKKGLPYLEWKNEGLIEATEGNLIDYDHITHRIDVLAQRYDIQEVAYDRWGATQLIQDLQELGMEVIPFGQGFRDMSPATKELMNVVLAKRLRHGGHKVLRWMASNMVVRLDPAGNLKPDKSKSTEKIDGLVALIMGLDRATRREGGSVYDERDMLIL